MASTIFTSRKLAAKLAAKYGTPIYVYNLRGLEARAKQLLEACSIAGCLPRYAIKANPHERILKLFARLGLGFDASSEYEGELAVSIGIAPQKINLSSQQPPKDLEKILQSRVEFTATSLHQLELVAQTGWQGNIGVRINPGIGAGGTNRTATVGVSASFGIWHEYIPKILRWQKRSGCQIVRLHIHIGSGYDPKIWHSSINTALSLVEQLPSVTILNMGGGFKVARMPDETEAGMAKIIRSFNIALKDFRRRTDRDLRLEIEPGTWLVANNGLILSRVVDIVDTGKNGFQFIKLDTGMNDFLRPAMYGAQHEIEVLNQATSKKHYVVVGHNCESGDILTPEPGNPELIRPRLLNMAGIGDLVAIGGAGAYGASMRVAGYNSFPSAAEVFVDE